MDVEQAWASQAGAVEDFPSVARAIGALPYGRPDELSSEGVLASGRS
jgi:hypothetical protein